MSSSVQLDSGKTRIDSPACTRPLNRLHSSGRWFFGSHWPNSSRKLNTRSLARAFSSSRRAPPNSASNRYFSTAASRTGVCIRLRIPSGDSRTSPASSASGTDATRSCTPSSPTRRSRKSSTSGKLCPVSTCITGNGIRAGANAFSARRPVAGHRGGTRPSPGRRGVPLARAAVVPVPVDIPGHPRRDLRARRTHRYQVGAEPLGDLGQEFRRAGPAHRQAQPATGGRVGGHRRVGGREVGGQHAVLGGQGDGRRRQVGRGRRGARPQPDVDGPVGTAGLAVFPGTVQGIHDPDALGVEPGGIIPYPFFGEHRVTRPPAGQGGGGQVRPVLVA